MEHLGHSNRRIYPIDAHREPWCLISAQPA
jgi:hypothetical protein